MTPNMILAEVKKAIDLWLNNTYNESELYSHFLAIIRDGRSAEDDHREQMERLLYKVEQLRHSQQQFHGGNKKMLSTCKAQEADMDKRIHFLKGTKGYSTERFKKQVAVQNKIFG